MKFLENIVNKIRPTFSKGGKLGFLHSTFDAFATFLFVDPSPTRKGAHVRDCNDLKRVMIVVVLALVPAALFGMYNVGYQYNLAAGAGLGFWGMFWYGFLKVLPLYLVSYIVGLGIEFAVAQARGHEVNEGYLVSGMIIPLIMPVTVPLWILALGVAFAVILGKEIFGGTGMNIWNPALLARAFVFFAYPSRMSGDMVWIDGYSGATPLGQFAVGEPLEAVASVKDMVLGFIPGSVGETSVVAILLGALLLLITGVASWKVMLSCVGGAVGMGLLLNAVGAEGSYASIPFYYHLITGGFAFGCVFMATDPVTGAQTEAGKWIYGFLIGVMVIVIRVFNPGYPEGMMLAILLMNTFAPLIDHYVVQANVRRRTQRALRYEQK